MATNDLPAGARPVRDPGTDDGSRPLDRKGGTTLDALECALIDEFLVDHGHTLQSIRMLPAALREELLGAAAEHASLKLAELECRAHFVKELES
jgi:hypothetical protein